MVLPLDATSHTYKHKTTHKLALLPFKKRMRIAGIASNSFPLLRTKFLPPFRTEADALSKKKGPQPFLFAFLDEMPPTKKNKRIQQLQATSVSSTHRTVSAQIQVPSASLQFLSSL